MKIFYSLRLYSTFGLLALAVSCGQGNVNENFSANTQDAEQQFSNKTTINADSALNADDDEVMGLEGQAKVTAVANRVTSLYKSTLEREPNREELMKYVFLILSNKLSPYQVNDRLKKSPEGIVVRSYRSILRRRVDPGNRYHYTRKITDRSLNEAGLRAILFNSSEYREMFLARTRK